MSQDVPSTAAALCFNTYYFCACKNGALVFSMGYTPRDNFASRDRL